MVVKHQCSFCAGEIEPGTGSMFVKRDGTVFHFCSSSCRKQQLKLGRAGHRLKWTRAHLLKRASEAASSSGGRARSRTGPTRAAAPSAAPASDRPAPAAASPAPATPAVPPAAPAAPAAEAKKPAADETAPAKKPRRPRAAKPPPAEPKS